MVSAAENNAKVLGSRPGHCVVFLGKTFYSPGYR